MLNIDIWEAIWDWERIKQHLMQCPAWGPAWTHYGQTVPDRVSETVPDSVRQCQTVPDSVRQCQWDSGQCQTVSDMIRQCQWNSEPVIQCLATGQSSSTVWRWSWLAAAAASVSLTSYWRPASCLQCSIGGKTQCYGNYLVKKKITEPAPRLVQYISCNGCLSVPPNVD